jgi:hypothetical protein
MGTKEDTKEEGDVAKISKVLRGKEEMRFEGRYLGVRFLGSGG